MYTINFLPDGIKINVSGGTVLEAARLAGLAPNAPCGGRGTCGKCKIHLDGEIVLACQTTVDRDMTVAFVSADENSSQRISISSSLSGASFPADSTEGYCVTFDIG